MARKKSGVKKMDVWKFEKDGNTADVTVYLDRTGDGAIFRAECEPLFVEIENPNIDELEAATRKAVYSALTREFKSFFKIEWSGTGRPGDRIFKPEGCEYGGRVWLESRVVVEKVFIAETPEGKVFKSERDGEVRKWHFTPQTLDRFRTGRNSVLIEDNETNRAALDRIAGGFEDLNRSIDKLLHPENIERNMLALAANGGRFLTAGEPAE